MVPPRPVPQLAWPSDAALAMPGSKSSANRLLVAAAASGRTVRIRGLTPGDDVQRMLDGLRTLGFAVDHEPTATTVVVGPRRADAPSTGTIDCGNGGTTLRFLVSLAATTPGDWILTGDAAMQHRPIGELVAAWRLLGAEITDTNGCPPVHVRGDGVHGGGPIAIDASRSSQFVSSLLLVAPSLRDGLMLTFATPIASADYVGMTRDVLDHFGVRSLSTPGSITVRPGWNRVPLEVAVDGDWSSFGVWTCLDHLTGSRVRSTNLATDSGQPDEGLAAVLAAMPKTGDHTVDVEPMPDQFLNLAIVAAHRPGTTQFVGGANLRHKECDRIAVMARELAKAGVAVAERADGLVVHGGKPLQPTVVDPANDHRVAMAWALAGMLSPGIAIADADCVTKSYPGFWRDLDVVLRIRRCVVFVGMRAAGKSTTARAFATRVEARWIDTDAKFEAQHGPIADFVAAQGWPAFRALEEGLVAKAVQPGQVVSIGGGAIESAATRRLLREQALVVWLDADATVLRDRLRRDPDARPSVTGAPVLDELDALLARRRPLYGEVANVRLDAHWPTGRQVESTMQELGRSCRWT
ncbi:MAG: 3-phosphoshikimate 1-carboxyvinyltransferase [Planctomycetes bacterium]|nr:3-phosphoshikimate 1-carboxyvinyltransferase [Planctomycetota bacterium]